MPTQVIVSDENCPRHCQEIFYVLERLGYKELLSLELKTIVEAGLYYDIGPTTMPSMANDG